LKDKYNQTPLSVAAGKGHAAVVKLLLEIGKANIDLKDSYGRTPLSRAAEKGYEAVVKLMKYYDPESQQQDDTMVGSEEPIMEQLG
jgi:ankyrin repeat protein